MSHQFTSAVAALTYMAAGNATFTISSRKTGAHFTYRMRLSDDKKVYFVSLRSGGEGEKNWQYIGVLRTGADVLNNGLFLTGKSQRAAGDVEVRAFNWVWAQVAAGKLPADLEIRHEGTCGRCARPLTHPDSIDAGIGPECAKKFSCEAA